jgi:hypothetical protein
MKWDRSTCSRALLNSFTEVTFGPGVWGHPLLEKSHVHIAEKASSLFVRVLEGTPQRRTGSASRERAADAMNWTIGASREGFHVGGVPKQSAVGARQEATPGAGFREIRQTPNQSSRSAEFHAGSLWPDAQHRGRRAADVPAQFVLPALSQRGQRAVPHQ